MNFSRLICGLALVLTSCLPLAPVAAGWQYLTLNNRANEAVLEDNGNPSDNLIQLRSVNGTFDTMVFPQPEAMLFIDLAGGSDKLTIDGSGLGIVTAEIVVVGGRGHDNVVLESLVTSANVFVDDFYGNNSYLQRGTSIGNSLHINDGLGRQTISIRQGPFDPVFEGVRPVVAGSVFVTSTGGGSSITVGNVGGQTRIEGGISVSNAGFGRDTFRYNRARVAGDVYLDMGSGRSEFISTAQGLFGGRVSHLVNSGTINTRIIQSAMTSLDVVCNEGSSSLFLGDVTVGERISVQNQLGFDTQTIFGVQVPEFSIDNGEGGSRLAISSGDTSTRIERLTTHNTSGSDEVELTLQSGLVFGPFRIDDVSINNGSGNSTVLIKPSSISSLSSGSVGNVRISSEDGNDRLALTDATIDGELIAFHGTGGSDVDIHNSSIGGFTDINSGEGVDYVTLEGSTFGDTTYVNTGDSDDTLTLIDSLFAGDFAADCGGGWDIFATDNNSVFGGFEYIVGFETLFEF